MSDNYIVAVTTDITVLDFTFDVPNEWLGLSIYKVNQKLLPGVSDDFILERLNAEGMPYGGVCVRNATEKTVVFSYPGVENNFDLYISPSYALLVYKKPDLNEGELCCTIHCKGTPWLGQFAWLRPTSYYSTWTSRYISSVPLSVFRIGTKLVEIYPKDSYQGVKGDVIILDNGVFVGGFGLRGGSRSVSRLPKNLKAAMAYVRTGRFRYATAKDLSPSQGIYANTRVRGDAELFLNDLEYGVKITSLNWCKLYSKPVTSVNDVTTIPYVLVDRKVNTYDSWTDYYSNPDFYYQLLSECGFTDLSYLVFDSDVNESCGLDSFINQEGLPSFIGYTSDDQYILSALSDYADVVHQKLTVNLNNLIDSCNSEYHSSSLIIDKLITILVAKHGGMNSQLEEALSAEFGDAAFDIGQLFLADASVVNYLYSLCVREDIPVITTEVATTLDEYDGTSSYVGTLNSTSADIYNSLRAGIDKAHLDMRAMLPDTSGVFSNINNNINFHGESSGLGYVKPAIKHSDGQVSKVPDGVDPEHYFDSDSILAAEDMIVFRPNDKIEPMLRQKISWIKEHLQKGLSFGASCFARSLCTNNTFISATFTGYKWYQWLTNGETAWYGPVYRWFNVYYRSFPPFYEHSRRFGDGAQWPDDLQKQICYGTDENGNPYSDNWGQGATIRSVRIVNTTLRDSDENHAFARLETALSIKGSSYICRYLHRNWSVAEAASIIKDKLRGLFSNVYSKTFDGVTYDVSIDFEFTGRDLHAATGHAWPRRQSLEWNYDTECHPDWQTDNDWTYYGQYKDGFSMSWDAVVHVTISYNKTTWSSFDFGDVVIDNNGNSTLLSYADFVASLISSSAQKLLDKQNIKIITEQTALLFAKLASVGYGRYLIAKAYDTFSQSILPLEVAPFFSDLRFDARAIGECLKTLATAQKITGLASTTPENIESPLDIFKKEPGSLWSLVDLADSTASPEDTSDISDPETPTLIGDADSLVLSYPTTDKSIRANLWRWGVWFCDLANRIGTYDKIPAQFTSEALSAANSVVEPEVLPLYLEV